MKFMDSETLPEGSSDAVPRHAEKAAVAGQVPLSIARCFLRIPPFPGANIPSLQRGNAELPVPVADLEAAMRRLKVGGSFWGAQPDLPAAYVLTRSARAVEHAKLLGPSVVLWADGDVQLADDSSILVINDLCDPWHVLSGATAFITENIDEIGFVAGLLDVPVHRFEPLQDRLSRVDAVDLPLVSEVIAGFRYQNPFSGSAMTAVEAAELCGFWRQLIDSNRDIVGGLGFAFWKQDHVAPLLWNGSEPFSFIRKLESPVANRSVAVWRSKLAPKAIEDLAGAKIAVVEVEDGFLRSSGLGSDCIPPLSITVDRRGAYFDPSQASDLEDLLEKGSFGEEIIDRARKLRQRILQHGLGKYERGIETIARPAGTRLTILVPGQVEDDRAVLAGGCGLVSNLDLLRKVREQAPDAYIIYKPHPDVVAGHRRGAISDESCLQYADQVLEDASIGSLIAMVDEVHVNTSLAGFEALMHGKAVSTYGVPFYAGWGLTKDVGSIPARRTARRSLDELSAATLLMYPRYLDPVSRLPCPAEVVVARLVEGEERDPSLLVGMRRLQGKLMRRLRSLVQ